jgi:hypothetical protein
MTTLPTLNRPLLFTVKEAAAIADWKPQNLLNWVAQGWLTPAVRGGVGRSSPHKFAAQQLLGMAAVSAMAAHRWTSKDKAVEVLKMFGDMSDSALHDWIGIEDSSGHAEEAAAVFGMHPLLIDHGVPITEECRKVSAEVHRRMDHAADCIRRRLRGQRDRFTKR